MVGPQRVLIVEPDPEVRTVVGLMLERAGYTVSGAPDAKFARSLLQQHPDIRVIVADASLRGETAISLSESVEARGVPMVMMSGRPSAIVAAETEHNRLLLKPFTQTKLVEALKTVLDSG
jgi:DNA-binding NtrC family response regulator